MLKRGVMFTTSNGLTETGKGGWGGGVYHT